MANRRRSRQAPEGTGPIPVKHRHVILSRHPCSVAVPRTSGPTPTSKRRALAQLLLVGPYQQINAEELHQRVMHAYARVPLANTPEQFREARLLRDVTVEASHAYFDNDTSDHPCFFLAHKQGSSISPPAPSPLKACSSRLKAPRSPILTWPFWSQRQRAKAFPGNRMDRELGAAKVRISCPPCRPMLRRPKPGNHAPVFFQRSNSDDRYKEGSLRHLSHACS